jgi:hypothetical protein
MPTFSAFAFAALNLARGSALLDVARLPFASTNMPFPLIAAQRGEACQPNRAASPAALDNEEVVADA